MWEVRRSFLARSFWGGLGVTIRGVTVYTLADADGGLRGLEGELEGFR